jgi:hypothetical protein
MTVETAAATGEVAILSRVIEPHNGTLCIVPPGAT